jgi:NADPH:quinone reductase-like Zn-dependent oxidoreductase
MNHILVKYKEQYEAGTGPKFVTTLVQPSGEELQKASELFDSGKLKVKVVKEFTLEEAGLAHDLVIDGHAGGKVILTI